MALQCQFALLLMIMVSYSNASPTNWNLVDEGTPTCPMPDTGFIKTMKSYLTSKLPTMPSVPTLGLPLPFIGGKQDPEQGLPPEGIISRWDYPWQIFNVTTEDGYILSMYRIPGPKGSKLTEVTKPNQKRPVVFLQHGLECSCADWISNLPHQSAAFIFADAGFDVFMGNFRGNTFSKGHKIYSPEQNEFWRFSWDHMARYDLPAMVNTALEITGADQVYYMGHSMGTLTAFAKFSDDQQFAKKIKKFYALGPVHTINYIKGVFSWLVPCAEPVKAVFERFGVKQFLPENLLVKTIGKLVCGNPIAKLLCTNALVFFAGPDSKQMNTSRLPVYLSHTPAGTSVQNIVHFGQMARTQKCIKFDYDNATINEMNYGQPNAPEYDVGQLNVPTALFWGGEDWLATPNDVKYLHTTLPNVFMDVHLKDFAHLDFIWGLRAAPEIYEPVASDIKEDYYK